MNLGKALDIAPDIAIFETVFLVLMLLLNRHLINDESSHFENAFDKGPLWRKVFYRVWAACHIPAMIVQFILQATVPVRDKERPIAIPIPALHIVNFLIVVCAYSL